MLPEILEALSTTTYAGYHYIKMLVNNANSIGAAIEVENQCTKQHLIPALKLRKAANLGTIIVDTSFVYESWGDSEYNLAFGDDLAM